MLPWEKQLAVIDTDVQHYHYCFGCGSENPLGLKLAFTWDGKNACTDFTPTLAHQGWPGAAHGGLIGAILDEALGWAAYFQGIKGVTSKMVVRLKQPLRIGQTVRVSASTTGANRKLVKSRAAMTLDDGAIVAEAIGTLYVLPQSQLGIG